MKRIFLAFAVTIFSQPVFAGDIAAGKANAITCMACHGAAGISPNDIWPNLAGQKGGIWSSRSRLFEMVIVLTP